MNIGILQQEHGDLDAAAARYQEALELLGRARNRRLEAIALGNQGTLHQERGNADRALECHERALAALIDVGDVRSQVLALTRVTAAYCALGRSGDADRALRQAKALCGDLADPVTRACVVLAAAFADVGRAHELYRERPDGMLGSLARARSLMAAAHDATSDRPAPAEVSDDIRAALRLLHAEIARLHPESTGVPAEDALAITAGAAHYRPPGGEWVDLQRYPVLRRVLASLVDHRYEAPGRGLSLEAVQHAAWPGERIRADAAANRIYVAMSKLRRQGLRPYLVRNEEGYLLDEKLQIKRDDVGPPRSKPT
jgi:hypothetical protein